MHVWLEVTKDKYELPLAISDTARELAEIVGVSKNTILSTRCHAMSGKGKWKNSKYIMVDIGDDEIAD